jgi:hypothetical protein
MRGAGIVNLLRAFAVWHTRRMNTLTSPNRYKNHRFPAEIISHGVWLYYRFCLSYRDVEEFLFVRGVIVSYEAIRTWCRKFGQSVHKMCLGSKWHEQRFSECKGSFVHGRNLGTSARCSYG